MDAKKEESKWMDAKYPYDRAKCGVCASSHNLTGMCLQSAHAAMRREAARLDLVPVDRTNATKELLVKFRAFRKKFAKFYPKRDRQIAAAK